MATHVLRIDHFKCISILLEENKLYFICKHTKHTEKMLYSTYSMESKFNIMKVSFRRMESTLDKLCNVCNAWLSKNCI